MKNIYLSVILCAATSFASAQMVRYVMQGAGGGGTSWMDASGDLQEMINQSNPGEEVWVAEGTYIPERRGDNPFGPHTLTDRYNSFVLHNGVKVYGGFAGGESQIEQRNIAGNSTILDGAFSAAAGSARCYHVVLIVGANDVVLDGFEIKNGEATTPSITIINNDSIGNNGGAGMTIKTTANVKLANLKIHDNRSSYGGGMNMHYSSDCEIRNVSMYNNQAMEGGGISMAASNPTLINVLIYENTTSYRGGGLYVESSYPTLINVTVAENQAGNMGGSISSSNSNIKLQNSIIADEIAIDVIRGFPYTVSAINIAAYNSMIHSIYIAHSPNLSHNQPSNPSHFYPVFDLNNSFFGTIRLIPGISGYITPNVIYNNTQGYPPQGPGFVIPVKPGDYHLLPHSQGIDAGDQSYVTPHNVKIDLDGNRRIFGGNVDMGVYEHNSPPATPDIINAGQKSMLWNNNNHWEEAATMEDVYLSVYPNPTMNGRQTSIILKGNIRYYEKAVYLKLYSIDGKLLYSKNYSDGNIQANLPDLPSGMYMLNLQTQEGERYSQKLFIDK
jgi:hypothetical protein